MVEVMGSNPTPNRGLGTGYYTAYREISEIKAGIFNALGTQHETLLSYGFARVFLRKTCRRRKTIIFFL